MIEMILVIGPVATKEKGSRERRASCRAPRCLQGHIPDLPFPLALETTFHDQDQIADGGTNGYAGTDNELVAIGGGPGDDCVRRTD